MALATEQGFAQHLAQATIMRGWALAAQGQGAEGMAQMRQGLAAYQATGSELHRPYYLALLAEAYGSRGQTAEGLSLLAEALATVDRTGERGWEAELHRLKGELLLAQAGARPTGTGGGGVFPPGPRRGPPSAGQILGAAGRDEPQSPLAAAGQAGRSP